MSSNSSPATRTFVDEVRSLEKNWMLDLGHPLLNRVAESFVKAAGIGAIQAVARESYFMAIEGEAGGTGAVSDTTGTRKRTFPDLHGLAAGMHSGLTYGLTEVRGTHDWKNSVVAGALTGAAVVLTSERASHEQIVQSAITGAALSAAANVFSGIF